MSATQLAVGTIGFTASALNYFGIGGSVTSTVSSSAGVFGLVLGMPSNWYTVYKGAYDMQYQSASYYPSDSEIFGN